MKKLALILIVSALLSCKKDDTPIVTEWIGISTTKTETIEKTFKTAGKGWEEIKWWAGGYTYKGGFFRIELLDVEANKYLIRDSFMYGDKHSGNDELPKFQWWHSEVSSKIVLKANTKYTMKLTTRGLAQPGAGWGMWLYEFGTEPKRHENAKR